ncbi:hypothetical protein BOVMAS03_16380 [Streptococcus uberis]|uniref:hypothetical protein n=1 Tax=Streptococcus uberis TaxID=1349 RepID=UPI0033404977
MKDSKLKHIDLIQLIINRMSQNSFMIKGWTITIIVGLFVFLKSGNCIFDFFVYLIPIISFWFLDSYYLCQERLYRELYKSVISDIYTESNLDLSVNLFRNKIKYKSAIFSRTEILFYVPITALVFIILLLR